MNSAELIFTNSPWWIAIAIIVGILYAWLLYSKKGPWNDTLKKVLFVLRSLAIALIILLLINPMMKSAINTTVKPIAVLLFDNSSSIPLSIGEEKVKQSFKELESLQKSLTEQGYDVKLRTLQSEVSYIDSIKSNSDNSNLSKSIDILTDVYNASELAFSVLVSDGIYNLGTSPDYKNFSKPVYTVGLGDTISKKDIIIKDLRYNKIAYLDNQFPLEVEILQNGYQGLTTKVNLRKNGSAVQSKTITFTEDIDFKTVSFLGLADKPGLNRYTVEIAIQDDEQSAVNNRKDVYIDIIDNKDKILILGSAPHPDIKAIKSVLEINKNYEVYDYFPGINEYEDQPYSLVIAHQPFSGNAAADRQLKALKKGKTPVWYILGKSTNINTFNQENNIIEISQTRGQFDKAGASLNPNFGKFTLEDVNTSLLAELPPIEVAYGNYTLKGPAEKLLNQKIGSINSDRPLLLVSNNTEVKEAVLLGSGLWSWRILEAVKNDEKTTFNNLFSKLIQYLNTKEDKRKFRVTTSKDEFNDSENVVFNTDVYNEIYEKIYSIPVSLTVTNELGEKFNYSYVTSKGNKGYKIGGLEPGVYRYAASTELKSKKVTVSGGFSVVKLQIESVNLTADFNLLKRLANKTGGTFVNSNNLGQLTTELSQKKAQGVIYSEEDYSQLIELRWVLLFIVALVSAEWFIRKYSGGY